MQARSLWSSLVVLSLAGALLAGCGKSNPLSTTASPAASNDAAQVSSTLAAVAPVIDDGLMEAADQTSIANDGPAGSASLIAPLFYWRHISDVRRTYSFAFSDTDSTGMPTKATVSIHRYLTGTFNIVYDATPGDSMPFDSVAKVRKPLHDLWERNVLLARVRPKSGGHGDAVMGHGRGDSTHVNEWKVTALSGVQVTSYDPATSSDASPTFGVTKISKLRIQSSNGDTTITDPLRFFSLRHVFAFDPGVSVTLTVTTQTNDDIVVLIRNGMRRRFHNNGDNTYTIFWTASAEDGLHHIGVNALSHGTLFDDQAPYDSQAWIIPYRVNPCVISDYMP
jgi:hypothetical protein